MSKQKLDVSFFDRVSALPPEALTLMQAHEAEGSYMGPTWFANLEQTVFSDPTQGGRPLYGLLSRAGAALCVLPLQRLPSHSGDVAVESLSSCYTPLYAPALAATLTAEELAHLLMALKRELPKLSSLSLSPMAPETPSYRLMLAALRLAGLATFEYFRFENWFNAMDGDWDRYLAARDGKLRSTLSRKGRRFLTEGGRLEIIQRPEDILRGEQAYAEVYARSWKQPEPFPDFIPGVMHCYAKRGELRLGLAYLGDRPIAAQLWLVSHGLAEIHKLAYDEEFKTYSAGSLLTEKLMRHVVETDRVKEVDYLIGADAYKRQWMDQRRERWGIVAYNPRTFSGMFGLATELLGRLTKGLRQRLRELRPQHADTSAAAR